MRYTDNISVCTFYYLKITLLPKNNITTRIRKIPPLSPLPPPQPISCSITEKNRWRYCCLKYIEPPPLSQLNLLVEISLPSVEILLYNTSTKRSPIWAPFDKISKSGDGALGSVAKKVSEAAKCWPDLHGMLLFPRRRLITYFYPLLLSYYMSRKYLNNGDRWLTKTKL